MKKHVKYIMALKAFFLIGLASSGQSLNNSNLARARYLSLQGQILRTANNIDADGNIHVVKAPLLRILRTNATVCKGLSLILPGGDYHSLVLKNEAKEIADFLNHQGLDVVILDYTISAGPQTEKIALQNAREAFILLKSRHADFGLRGNKLNLIGITSGANLTAHLLQTLTPAEQPDNMILLSPSRMDETMAGTVLPAVMPPTAIKARLFISVSTGQDKKSIASCSEYAKKWTGFDGDATFELLSDSNYLISKKIEPFNYKSKLATTLTKFLNSAAIVKDTINPAAIAVEGYNKKRHDEKSLLVAKQKFDLIMIGNSITNNFEKPEYQPVWRQFFAPRNALNLGFSGYRTENLIWNIQNGELDGQSPKVVVLEIGTNNIDEINYPTRHTASQLAGGITAIVHLIRQKLPDTQIILLRSFPGCYSGPNPTSHRAILERASDIVAKLADEKHIFYCDVNHVFLNMDGSINQKMMADWLHPTPTGAKAWAQAMEPLLSQLMGDKSLDTEISENTAIMPVPKLENDSYNWWDRHAEVLRIKDSLNPQIILIGNSITHFWGGNYPQLRYADGRPRQANGPVSWSGLFGAYRVLNLGFGWDRTQNVLWRLDHGEVDGLHPQTVVLDIGTNNTSQTNNARINTADEIVAGIRAVCARVRSKLPGANIILMAVFPREKDPASPRRILITEINRQLKLFAKDNKITLVDIGADMLAGDGIFLPGMMLDFTHPTDKGYQIWADAIRSFIW